MELITKVFQFITNADNLKVALAVVGAFSTIATLTANKTDNKIVNVLLKIINFLAFNFGKARNKDDV